MAVKIGRHGNSLSLRLPAFIAQSMKLKAGDYVSLRYLDDGSLRVVPVNEDRIIPATASVGGYASVADSGWDEVQWWGIWRTMLELVGMGLYSDGIFMGGNIQCPRLSPKMPN